MKRRTSRRKQVVAALALLILTVPMVVPAEESFGVVEGHTTYVDMDGLDPCLAAIAGMVSLRVLWFDGSVLHERTNFEEGDTYIYATQSGAPDPTNHVRGDPENLVEDTNEDDKVLVTSHYYNFTDPNGYAWNVTEVYYEHDAHADADETGDGVSTNDQDANASYEAGTERYYAWIVKVGPTIDDLHAGTATHEVYNFVNMVNSCKFTGDPPNGSVNHTNPPPGFEHDNSTDDPHDHQTWQVDLYVGKEPSTIPLGMEPPHWMEGYRDTEAKGDHETS